MGFEFVNDWSMPDEACGDEVPGEKQPDAHNALQDQRTLASGTGRRQTRRKISSPAEIAKNR